MILTQTERLTINNRPKDPKTARNKNVLVVGGSGSGKTRFFVKPQIMQMHSSYCITDPKGGLLCETGKMLQKNGYKIKVLNTINFKKSMHYNPFSYIQSEKDVLKLVTCLMQNTKGEGKGSDPFWEKAEQLLYTALIGYIWLEAPEEEKNFNTLIEMINAMEVREDDEDFENQVDIIFRELKEKNPNHFAVRQYAKYRLAVGKTAKSILVSAEHVLQFSILRNSVKSQRMTNWSLIQLETEKRHCSSSCPTPTTVLTFSSPCAIHSFSTCYVKKRTMCTAEGFPFM